MAVYTRDYPALDPLASGVDDSPAEGIVAGTALSDAHITAARLQHRERKHFLVNTGRATQDEVVASLKRKTQLIVENASRQPVGPDATLNAIENLNTIINNLNNTLNDPNTGLQALSTRVAALNNTIDDPDAGLQALSTRVAALDTRVAALNTKIEIESAQHCNRAAIKTNTEEIRVVKNEQGRAPREDQVWFPATNRELASATSARLNPLLRFYGLQLGGSLDDKRGRIRAHLAIQIG